MNTCETDYMKLATELMETISDEGNIFNLCDQKPLIDRICDLVEKTPIYQNNIRKVDEFKNELLEVSSLSKRLRFAWNHFCERSILAPTSFHLRGVVIFCLPVVRWILNDIQQTENQAEATS